MTWQKIHSNVVLIGTHSYKQLYFYVLCLRIPFLNFPGWDGTAAYTRMYCSLYPDVLQLIPDGTAAYIITVRIKLPQSSWAGDWTELGNKHKNQQIQVILWYWGVWFDSLEPKNQLILGFPDLIEKFWPQIWARGKVQSKADIRIFTKEIFDFGHQRARTF